MNHILIVEDERDLAVTYERLLRRAGHPVQARRSRAEGLRCLAADPPRLVIADLRLPDGDGLDVIRAARALDPLLPVIVITAFASRAAREAAVASGASAFLAKPFRTAEFASLVESLLEQHPTQA